MPTSKEEISLLSSGYKLIAGIDEVGRGCLAGPVIAAAVVLPPAIHYDSGLLAGLRDSKLLGPGERERLFKCIQEVAVGLAVGTVPSPLIDALGIAEAGRQAMVEAVMGLAFTPDYLLIDFFNLPTLSIPQKGIIDGDSLCLSIAAASVVAKVTRDRWMIEQEGIYPGYGFARHKGYATRDHCQALLKMGPCPLHRRSFTPVKDLLPGGNALG